MRKCICLIILVAAAAAPIRAAQFNTLIDFGDSLSDIGNDLSITFSNAPAAPGYYMGRFSNGPIWIDQLAKDLKLPAPTPSKAGGNDYAYGGVTTGTGNTTLYSKGIITIKAPNVSTQVTSWTTANTANNQELFTLLGGANDMFAVLEGKSTVTAATVAQNMANNVQALYNDSARSILIANLPDLGKTPRYLGTALQKQATTLSTTFNTDLNNDLAALNDPGLNLYQLSLYNLTNSVIANPKQYGLTNVTQAAYTGDTDFSGKGAVAANSGTYLFWDSVHPTSAFHTIVGDAAFNLLPEPGSLSLAVLSLPLLVRRHRRPQPRIA